MNRKLSGVRYPECTAIDASVSYKNRVKGNGEMWNRWGSHIEKQLCSWFAVSEIEFGPVGINYKETYFSFNLELISCIWCYIKFEWETLLDHESPHL